MAWRSNGFWWLRSNSNTGEWFCIRKKCLQQEAIFQTREKVGSAPVTQKCIDSDKVRGEFCDEDDEMNKVVKSVHEQNDQGTFFLTCHGYDGSLLKFKLNKKKVTAPITHHPSPITHHPSQYTKSIEFLAKARIHRVLFHATGGSHITHDDFLRAWKFQSWQRR